MNRSVEFYAGKCNTVGSTDGPRRDGAILNGPKCIAVDGTNLYFTDMGSLRKIDVTGYVSTLIPRPTDSTYGGLHGIEISHSRPGAGSIFVTDELAKTIKSIDEGGAVSNIDIKPNLLSRPVALAIDSKGNIFVADKDQHQIFVIYANGDLIPLAGLAGQSGYLEGVSGLIAKFNEPAGIALNERIGAVYVSDSKNKVVRTIKIE